MCTHKAKDFYEALGSKKTFSASSGSLTRFKKGHGICKLAVQEEQLSASVDTLCKNFLKCTEEQICSVIKSIMQTQLGYTGKVHLQKYSLL